MALIKCPECNKEISDKSEICIGCGFPIKEYLRKMEEEEEGEKVKREQQEKEQKELEQKYWCRSCYRQNEIGEDYCVYCGYRLTPYFERKVDLKEDEPDIRSKSLEEEKREFNGIYKYTLFGGKQEVYCPRCRSENCSHYQEQKIIPGKTKTRYTANLNPLRPFTLVNKKEKVVRKDQLVTERKIICNDCGMVFY